MTIKDQELLKSMLTQLRVLSLSVLTEEKPYVSLLPYAMKSDLSAALIHASNMAKHTAGLFTGAPFSMLVNIPDSPDANPLVLPRVSLQGTVTFLNKDSSEYNEAMDIYITKFPESKQFFTFADFNIYQLNIEDGRFVADFGRVYNLTRETISKLAGI